MMLQHGFIGEPSIGRMIQGKVYVTSFSSYFAVLNFVSRRLLVNKTLNIVTGSQRSKKQELLNFPEGSKGPSVLLENLRTGLSQNGTPYRLIATNDNYLSTQFQLPQGRFLILSLGHSDQVIELIKKVSRQDTLLGPNLECEERLGGFLNENPHLYSAFLVPSEEARLAWRSRYKKLSDVKMEIWPTGIDLGLWQPKKSSKDKKTVIVYRKGQGRENDKLIISALQLLNFEVKEFVYGTYKRSEFRQALDYAKFAVWLGEFESQGISFFETWAMNVPIMVRTYGTKSKNKSKTQFCPYLTPNLGSFINEEPDLDSTCSQILEFLLKVEQMQFSPRQQMLLNYSARKSAQKLLRIL